MFYFPKDSDDVTFDDIPLIDDVTPLATLSTIYQSEGVPLPFLEQIDGLIDEGFDQIRLTRGM